MIRFVRFLATGTRALGLAMADVESIREGLGDRLPPLGSVSGKWLTIDQAYAEAVVDQP